SPVKDLDFTITTPQIREINVNDPVLVREDQVTLDFELPIAAEIEKESQSLSFDASVQPENIKVNEAVEIVPVTEVEQGGVIKYTLEEYMEVEKTFMDSKPTEPETPVSEELNITVKKVDTPKQPEFSAAFEEVSP